MQRLYEPSAYDTTVWPESHWRRVTEVSRPPLHGDERADVAVIGAGYTGLSAALALAERGATVTVVDAGQPGWGASGRNGGFCCRGGSKLSDEAIAARFGLDEARAFLAFQKAAIAHVAAELERHAIDAERGPPGELILAHSKAAWADMRAEAGHRAKVLGHHVRLIPPEELRQEGAFSPVAHGAIHDPDGFPLHPMRYVLGLARAAEAAGVRIRAESPVISLDPEGNGWRLGTADGTLRAGKVLIATNGYSSEDLPPWIGGRTLPALSTILTTRPLTEAELAAQGWTTHVMAADSRQLLHYFRLLPDHRFLFGMRGGLSAAPQAQARIRAEARRHFDIMFPAWAGVETDQEWSGFVCLTGSLTPFAGPVPGTDGLYAAFGWHGNGVSSASYSGHLIGRIMAGDRLSLPAVLATPPRRFPLAPFRKRLLALAYLWRGLTDGPVRAATT